MRTIPKDSATRAHMIIHRHMQQRFDKHREALEKHKEKGGPFAAAVEQLEKHLFG